MRDLKKAQLKERQLAEKKRQQQAWVREEDWDSQFQSTQHSAFGSAPKLEYDEDVEQALAKLLGKDQLENVKKEGYTAKQAKQGSDGEGDEEGKEEGDEDVEEGSQGEDEDEDKDDQKDSPGDDKDEDDNEKDSVEKSDEDAEKDEDDKKDEVDEAKNDGKVKPGEVQVPLEKHPKPWEVPEPQGRTEILFGVRYNSGFEHLFDDKTILKDRKPIRIVRVRAHYNKEYLVGVQFSYMTENEELVDGAFHGDKKVTLNNLRKVQYEIQYRERFTKISVCFSKGLHWLEIETNEGRSLLLGDKAGASSKAVKLTKEINSKKGEELTYVSGGYTGKEKRFTYLAFHLASGWGKEKDFFEDMNEANDDDEEEEDDDKAKADPVKAKADQDKAKADQDKAKVDPVKAKADQDKAKADPVKAKPAEVSNTGKK